MSGIQGDNQSITSNNETPRPGSKKGDNYLFIYSKCLQHVAKQQPPAPGMLGVAVLPQIGDH